MRIEVLAEENRELKEQVAELEEARDGGEEEAQDAHRNTENLQALLRQKQVGCSAGWSLWLMLLANIY